MKRFTNNFFIANIVIKFVYHTHLQQQFSVMEIWKCLLSWNIFQKKALEIAQNNLRTSVAEFLAVKCQSKWLFLKFSTFFHWLFLKNLVRIISLNNGLFASNSYHFNSILLLFCIFSWKIKVLLALVLHFTLDLFKRKWVIQKIFTSFKNRKNRDS